MKSFEFIKRDMVQGTLRHIKLFMFPAIVFSVICISVYNSDIRFLVENGMYSGKTGFLDYLLMINPGMHIMENGDMFTLPVYWFTIQIFIHYIIAYYPESDYRNFGKTVIIASGSRVRWWLGKCVWCIINVFLYFLLLISVVFVFSWKFSGRISFSFSKELMDFRYGDLCDNLNNSEALLICLIIPFFITLSVCLVQMILSFILKPVTVFAAVCGIYIVSAYYHHWLLPGGYTMWLRSSYVNVQGLTPHSGLIISGFLIITSIVVGGLYFKDKDIL